MTPYELKQTHLLMFARREAMMARRVLAWECWSFWMNECKMIKKGLYA